MSGGLFRLCTLENCLEKCLGNFTCCGGFVVVWFFARVNKIQHPGLECFTDNFEFLWNLPMQT